MVAAYRLLGEQGLVHRRQGRGTEIAGSDAALVSSHAAELTTSLQRNVFFRRLSEASADTIDLMGTLAPPCETVRVALDRAVKDLDVGGLARDHGYHPLGYPPLRRAVAAHLTSLGLPTDERRLLVTAGAQQAISLVMAYYLRPNELLLVEDPTFPGAIDAASTARGPLKEARRQELTDRLALLERLLRDRLPSWRWLKPSGGAALWVKLPAGSATDFAHTAALHEVAVAPGPVMSAIGGFDDFIRVPFGQAEDTLGEGVARLARAWTAYTRDGLTSRHLDVVV